MESSYIKAIALIGAVDDDHRLQARVPAEVPTGPVRLIVLLPDEDETGIAWGQGNGAAWSDELKDARQDIYTLEDGSPVDMSR